MKRASKTKKYRRWDDKVDYGRKFYSSYNHVDPGDKEADDFEVDVSDGNSAASKLLTDDRKWQEMDEPYQINDQSVVK